MQGQTRISGNERLFRGESQYIRIALDAPRAAKGTSKPATFPSQQILRYQPPVYSRIGIATLLGALADGRSRDAAEAQVHRAAKAVGCRYPGRTVTLTDSGTSALRLAVFASSGNGCAPRVAAPAYACPDIGTAVLGAGGRLMLFDTDASTLTPELEGVQRCLEQGATHVIAAHLFGRVFDIAPLKRLAAEFGAVVIEDAAQHAGGRVHGTRAGGLAEWSILSFGRGKGLNAGGGGALLSPPGTQHPALSAMGASASLRHLLLAGFTAILSHPRLYGMVASVPGSGVGETAFHAPNAPRLPARGMGRMISAAFAVERSELPMRREHERLYASALEGAGQVATFPVDPSTESGALRFPVRVDRTRAVQLQRMGVVRSYPRILTDYPALSGIIENATASMPGAAELARTLHTLPTHPLLQPSDRCRIIESLLALKA